MKTTIYTLLTATILGIASLISNQPINAADLLAIAFAAGLVAWAASEYSPKQKEPRKGARFAAVAAVRMARPNARAEVRLAA